MFEFVSQDLGRCGGRWSERVREALFSPGTWAVLGYRFRRWAYASRLPWPLRKLLNVAGTLVNVWVQVASNIELPVTAEIGPGLYVPHTGYIIVAARARIGRHCTLTQGVTIGHGGGGRKTAAGCPIIGDRVYVGPGAAVIGPIEVGNDALIAVGAVVIESVPAGGVAVGNPARLISRRGSFDLIEYPGMEADPDRTAAHGVLRPQPASGAAETAAA
jgi:serine O-acetyltransferase